MQLETISLDKLNPAEYNPRTITDEEFNGLCESLKTFGQQENLIVNKDMTIISGHQRYEAMKFLNWTEAVCNVVDLDKHQEKKLNVIMNSTAISGKYDDLKLSEILEELKLDDDYESLRLDKLEPLDLSVVEVEEDEVPEVSSEPPVSQLGEVYQLGRHRLMCGDSLKDMDKLMQNDRANLLVTDPPYGVSYADKNEFLNSIARGNRNQTKIENDHQTPEEMKEFWTETLGAIFVYLDKSASYYITSPQGGELLLLLLQSLYDIGFASRHMIIWSKNNHVLGRCDYNYKHEPILFGWLDKHNFYGGGKQKTSVWQIDKPQSSKEHPTMKPVELFVECILNSSKKSDIVCDPFLGSGTTLIACEQTDRICYGMEIDPKYVDVIRKRYWKFINDGNEEGWQEGTPAIK